MCNSDFPCPIDVSGDATKRPQVIEDVPAVHSGERTLRLGTEQFSRHFRAFLRDYRAKKDTSAPLFRSFLKCGGIQNESVLSIGNDFTKGNGHQDFS